MYTYNCTIMFSKFWTNLSWQIKVGNPFDDATKIGPVVSKEHMDKIMKYIQIAKQANATILCGETVTPKSDELTQGYFILPTVITDVKDTSELMLQEIFGPVVCVCVFDDDNEVIERANNINYGLAASLWTSNLGRAHRIAKKIECGVVWINCWMIRDLRMPFGGIKDSGMGREGYPFSRDVFTDLKSVSLSLI
ncbi:unnamed protein product [Didymodactylos carnosus]|uniref:Aldehyde dehydrogenase domain-containing protein n=1 Tax=Didymodactylos carnosus TaxID=1234261 RepID=A0A816CL92_9BILA|nr:unnamed protein product [Didymodactylos carnosus]CAF4520736.1 unnamed protein product [Didymodactylos carnosus]